MPKPKRNNKSKERRPKADPVQTKRIRALVWHHLSHEWVSLSIGSAAMIVSSLANQALPRLMGRLIDQKQSTNGSSAASATSPLHWVVLGGGLASLLRTTLLSRAEGNLAASLRMEAVQALLVRQDLQWFQTSNTTDLMPNEDDDDKETDAQEAEGQTNDKESDDDVDTQSKETSSSSS